MPKIPDAILNKLRCTNCKGWLSCGPVKVLENGGSICGRCKRIAPGDEYRHFAYEVLACYFQFPCKYWENHCYEGLSFKEVITHEDECSYSPGCCFCCCHPITACRSKRKLDITAGVQLEIIPETVLDYLRCGICAGYLSSTPVLVAPDGTSTCHRCSIQHSLLKKPEYRRHVIFEAFADMMIFPCVFRYEGCTNLYKFGEPMHRHEIECLYNSNRVEPVQSHPREVQEQGSSSPIYGNLTANAALFTLLTGRPSDKEMFLVEEFQKHKEILATKWSQQQEEIALKEIESHRDHQRLSVLSAHSAVDVITRPPLNRTDSLHFNPNFRNSFISELKLKQSFRKNRMLNSDDNHSVAASTISNDSNDRTNVRY